MRCACSLPRPGYLDSLANFRTRYVIHCASTTSLLPDANFKKNSAAYTGLAFVLSQFAILLLWYFMQVSADPSLRLMLSVSGKLNSQTSLSHFFQ